MNNSPIELLAKYIQGKDENTYQILEDIYTPDAVVKFEIRSNSISFPSEIIGNYEIAKVLSADFNKNYVNVKTYYFRTPKAIQQNIIKQKWLVIMKDLSSDKTRVGTGYYDMEFTSSFEELKIKYHKIYIHEMLELPDKGSIMLNTLHSKLDYPCVDSGIFMENASAFLELESIGKYIMT